MRLSTSRRNCATSPPASSHSERLRPGCSGDRRFRLRGLQGRPLLSVAPGRLSIGPAPPRYLQRPNHGRRAGSAVAQTQAQADYARKQLGVLDAQRLTGEAQLASAEARLVRWNKKQEEITGYSAEELMQMRITDWFRGEDASYIAARFAKVFAEGYADAEATLIR